ncbi:peroxidase family protein [Aspergillus lucknowensis]|uniref:Chloroperoxidase n=1 Tax=Aspergillus lucknowensis TaxID=176173 RepID=A0ABR4LDJ6_9EURO
MKLSLFAQSALLTVAAALPGRWHDHDHERHEWRPAGPNDSRSPCPGLNVMANHGYLPRSGRDIDLATFRNAIAGAYNYAPKSLDFAFQKAIDLKLSTTGNASTIHLSDLNVHDAIEFDGSLSRSDYNLGDNHSFDPEVWGGVAESLGLYDAAPDNEDDLYVTIEVAAKARAKRVAEAMALNPRFNASENQMMGSPGTTALYLTTMWDYDAGAAPKAWVRAFFEEERLPFLEGYRAPKTQKDANLLGAISKAVLAVKV